MLGIQWDEHVINEEVSRKTEMREKRFEISETQRQAWKICHSHCVLKVKETKAEHQITTSRNKRQEVVEIQDPERHSTLKNSGTQIHGILLMIINKPSSPPRQKMDSQTVQS